MFQTILYCQPNVKRTSESIFFSALKNHHPNALVSNSNFYVPPDTLDQFLDVEQIIRWLETESYFPTKKRLEGLDILKTFPSPQLRIAFTPKEISFDFVLQKNDRYYFWEFQERQHAKLKDDRPKRVYTPTGDPVVVPRFFQRLIRDLWRLSFFRPYTSVWKDWFESDFRASECLETADGYREFHLPGKFSFKGFLDGK
jgi:hypothetical protein